MIERHLTFNVIPARALEFEGFFADTYGPAMSSVPGFVRADLVRETKNPARYRMMYRFQDAASAAAWRSSQEHDRLQPSLNAMHVGSEVTAYDVVA